MSIRGAILVTFLLLLPFASVSATAANEGVSLSFSFTDSDQEVVGKSLSLGIMPPAFQDTDNNGIIDLVRFDGTNIPVSLDMDSAVGFSFDDGGRAAFYPSNLGRLPARGTYEVLGFLHFWISGNSRLVAVLLHQDENFDTSEGITAYIINNAGIRTGSLWFQFLDKAAVRYTAPYQQWLDTGRDFAIGTSPTVSNYFLIGKDLGLLDTILALNLSLTQEKTVFNQDLKIRSHEEWVLEESKKIIIPWGTIDAALTSGSQSVSVAIDGEEVKGTILVDQAQGISYNNERYVVFFPSTLNSLPSSPESGINWELLGILHYFDENGDINSRLALLIGQKAGEETTIGTEIRVVDNTGTPVGSPNRQFHTRRSARLMGSYSNWEEAAPARDWAMGMRGGVESTWYYAKDLGLTDKLLFISYMWF